MTDANYEDTVLNALAKTLEDIDGLQESGYMLDNPTPPCAEVIPGEIAFDLTMQRGLDTLNPIVRLTVGTASSRGAQKLLRTFRALEGPSSVKERIEDDRTLGGLVSTLQVRRIGPSRNFRRADGDTVLGCDFDVLVYS